MEFLFYLFCFGWARFAWLPSTELGWMFNCTAKRSTYICFIVDPFVMSSVLIPRNRRLRRPKYLFHNLKHATIDFLFIRRLVCDWLIKSHSQQLARRWHRLMIAAVLFFQYFVYVLFAFRLKFACKKNRIWILKITCLNLIVAQSVFYVMRSWN
jgi:hypothetical protein